MSNEQIRVVVRVRPLIKGAGGVEENPLAGPEKSVVTVSGGKVLTIPLSINVGTGSSTASSSRPDVKHYSFDHIFDSESRQDEVFLEVGKPLAESCLMGYNATVLAYGQTGSGKTFTMSGGLESKTRGLISRMFDYLFDKMQNVTTTDESKVDFSCRCSFLEIYNERISDLLNKESSKEDSSEGPETLHIREDLKHGNYVDGLITKAVKSAREAQQLLDVGNSLRQVAATKMNSRSSRSHTVFTMYVDSTTTHPNKPPKSVLLICIWWIWRDQKINAPLELLARDCVKHPTSTKASQPSEM